MLPALEEVITIASQKLRIAGIDSPRLEARIMLGHILGVDANQILFHNSIPSLSQLQYLNEMIEQRLSHQPLDKIIGHKDFYKASFDVNNHVLSPRPDTEILVEAAIAYAQSNKFERILDMGTGSGCILLSILGDVPNLCGIGLDKSNAALEIACANAQKMGLSARVDFVASSWFDKDLAEKLAGDFDFIVSNPPYIPSADILELEPEVKNFDPISALDGGQDGLRDYRQIAKCSYPLLKKGGFIFLEIGINQATDVVKIFVSQGFELVNIIKDLSGIERCIILKK